jgi:plastocyanin
MRRVVVVLCAVLVTLARTAPGQPAPEAGAIAGRVTLTARVRGAPLPSTAYPSRSAEAREARPSPEIQNVVVYLKDVAFRGALQPTRATLRQERETFVPHVLAIARGSTVDFPNDDPIFHNVFSLSSAATFDLRRYPQGQSRSHVFTRAGVVKVYCHIHSHMSATILVLDHPYFATPQPDGTFEIANVPPGAYTLVGWHERVGERRVTVRVERGRTTPVDVALPVEDAR